MASLFDPSAFSQQPGWLNALLPELLKGNDPSGMNAMAQAPPLGAPQPQQLPYAPPNPTMGDKLMAGASNFSDPRMGLIGRIANSFQGLSTGQRTDPQGIAQAQQQGLYQALRQKGVDHPTAIAAMSSPEIMKELGQFKQPQFVPNIGSDKFGQPRPGFIDPRTQTATLPNMAGAAQQPQGGGDPTLTGDDYLNSLDKGTGAQVKAMLEGRMAPPSGMAAKTPYWQRMLDMAASAEPGFDLTKWAQRQAGNKDFYGGGKSSEMVRAANQTIHHVGELVGSMDKLNNGQFPLLNNVGNAINTQLGKGAVTEFLPNAHAVAEEMSKVFKGANLSDAEVRQWEKSLNENMSPEQQRASVGKLMSLLNGSLQALETKRESSLGPALSAQKGPLLDKTSQDTLEKVNKWIAGEAPQAKTAAPPKIDDVQGGYRFRGGNPADPKSWQKVN